MSHVHLSSEGRNMSRGCAFGQSASGSAAGDAAAGGGTGPLPEVPDVVPERVPEEPPPRRRLSSAACSSVESHPASLERLRRMISETRLDPPSATFGGRVATNAAWPDAGARCRRQDPHRSQLHVRHPYMKLPFACCSRHSSHAHSPLGAQNSRSGCDAGHAAEGESVSDPFRTRFGTAAPSWACRRARQSPQPSKSQARHE
mmetsp:Transcript_6692/g.16065  ORF Transcript_6692/g.16065 Transcript_6692/m.16065 type:complete len:202 (+) Transcript_6692:302-907(+)